MTWDEMMVKLRRSGLSEAVLPVRGAAEGFLGLRQEGGRFVVTLMERGKTENIADFPTEESAVDFIYDSAVFTFRLNGDTRFDKWNANPKAFPLPKAEDFGGRMLPR
jgi:hypothetical protein